MEAWIGAPHPAARRVFLRHFAPSQQRAWVTLILTNHIIPPPLSATLMKRRTNQQTRGRSPVGILRVVERNSVWGRGESEDKHPSTSHRLDFFLIQVCAATHAQDTGTEAVDFLTDWGLRGKWSVRIWTWLFFSDGIVYVDIWAEQVHFIRAPPVMRNDRAGPLTRAWITWFITDHRIPRAPDRTLIYGGKFIKIVWLIAVKSTFPPKTSCALNWIFFPSSKILKSFLN